MQERILCTANSAPEPQSFELPKVCLTQADQVAKPDQPRRARVSRFRDADFEAMETAIPKTRGTLDPC